MYKKKNSSKFQNDNKLFQLYSDECKFIWLLTTENMKTLNYLGDYIINAFNLRKE